MDFAVTLKWVTGGLLGPLPWTQGDSLSFLRINLSRPIQTLFVGSYATLNRLFRVNACFLIHLGCEWYALETCLEIVN